MLNSDSSVFHPNRCCCTSLGEKLFRFSLYATHRVGLAFGSSLVMVQCSENEILMRGVASGTRKVENKMQENYGELLKLGWMRCSDAAIQVLHFALLQLLCQKKTHYSIIITLKQIVCSSCELRTTLQLFTVTWVPIIKTQLTIIITISIGMR